MKFMFDSCAFDKLLYFKSKKMLKENAKFDIEYYITSVQIAELCKTPNEEKRIKLILNLSIMRPKIIPTTSFILGYARLGYSMLGDGEIYKKLLNNNSSNVKDAIIAETANKEDCCLVTEDRKLFKSMKKNNYKVIDFDEFHNCILLPK